METCFRPFDEDDDGERDDHSDETKGCGEGTNQVIVQCFGVDWRSLGGVHLVRRGRICSGQWSLLLFIHA